VTLIVRFKVCMLVVDDLMECGCWKWF